MIFSEWPFVYRLAVSMKLPPRSMKRSMIDTDSATLLLQPKSSPSALDEWATFR